MTSTRANFGGALLIDAVKELIETGVLQDKLAHGCEASSNDHRRSKTTLSATLLITLTDGIAAQTITYLAQNPVRDHQTSWSRSHGTRSSLARAVCTHFGFLNARGLAQSGGCVKALRELERAGHFVLPAVRHQATARPKSPRRLDEPLAAAREVPEKAGDVRGLSLLRVETDDQMRIWNEMMQQIWTTRNRVR